MPKVGVLLSGCGVQDGSEIFETVLTLLALERSGADVSAQAIAPDVPQAEVINHYKGEESRGESRSVLAEAARIVRGKIVSTNEVSAHELDALIVIGGYGAVKNLCSYEVDGINAVVNPDVQRLIQEMNGLGKPIGAMCAGPIVVALALKNKNLSLTVGAGQDRTAADLSRMGVNHIVTQVDEICIDDANSLVTTPAFMTAHSVGEAEPGITKLVGQVLQMARENGPGHQGGALSTRSAQDV